MTAERDGKSRRTDQPDLLASLPDERPPASQPAPGIDPAAIEELVTGVRDIREQFAGLRQLDSADRPAPVPAALTPEALEAWGDKLVARVAEAARTADAPGDNAAATRIKRIEDAAAKAEAAAERIGQVREVLDILAWRAVAEAFVPRPLAASYSRSISSLTARI